MTPLEIRISTDRIGWSGRDLCAFLAVANVNRVGDWMRGRRPFPEADAQALRRAESFMVRLADALIDGTEGDEAVFDYDTSRTWEAALYNKAVQFAAWHVEGDGVRVRYRDNAGCSRRFDMDHLRPERARKNSE